MDTRYEIGLGALLETLGLDATNKLMAFLRAEAMFENVVPLIVAGSLNIRSPLVAQMLPQLAQSGLLSEAQCARLLAIGLHVTSEGAVSEAPSGEHALALDLVDAVQVCFLCSRCQTKVCFSKPGTGEPAAAQDPGGQWLPPENYQQWMQTCS